MITRQTAHNIAASLILPEGVLQHEINLHITGMMRTTPQAEALCRNALKNARKAIEETLTGQCSKESFTPVKARVMSICRNAKGETRADMLAIEDQKEIPARDDQILTIYIKND